MPATANEKTPWIGQEISPGKLNATCILSGTYADMIAAGGMVQGEKWLTTDTNEVYYYDGTSWIPELSGTTGDVIYPYSTTISDYTTPATVAGVSSDNALTYVDLYLTPTGWTQVGTKIVMANQRVEFQSPTNSTDHRLWKALPSTLSDTTWSCEFDYQPTTPDNGATMQPVLMFTAGSGSPTLTATNQDAVGFTMLNTTAVRITYKDGAGAWSVATGTDITITNGTQYYIRLERTSSTNIALSVFTDAARTTHVSGSPQNWTIPSTVTGLTHIQHANNFFNATGAYKSGNIDNLVIKDGSTGAITRGYPKLIDGNTATEWISNSEINPYCAFTGVNNYHAAMAIYYDGGTTTSTALEIAVSNDGTTWTVVRTVNTSLLTNGAWNYFRWDLPLTTQTFIRIKGTDAGAKVLALWEVKLLNPTLENISLGHGHKGILSTNGALALAT